MSKKDQSGLRQNKQLRRRYMTFVRMVRYGVNNFSRNAWLTTAATAVMTITLIVILSSFLTQQVFDSTIAAAREKIDISIYLKKDVSDGDVQRMQDALEQQSNVKSVEFVSADEAQKRYNAQNASDADQLKQLSDIQQDTGALLPASFTIKVKDLSKIDNLKAFVDGSKLFQSNLNPNAPPSYAANQDAIENIARTATFAGRVGMIISVIFVIISSLIIFNTIRMAIFNRKEEVQMMKLIGAGRGFIRGPFVVEAVMYGFFAALIATGLVYAGVVLTQDKLAQYGIDMAPTVRILQDFPGVIILAMITIGAILGILSSQMAVRRYLKV